MKRPVVEGLLATLFSRLGRKRYQRGAAHSSHPPLEAEKPQAPMTLHERKAVQHLNKRFTQSSPFERAISGGSGIRYDTPLPLAFQKSVCWLNRRHE